MQMILKRLTRWLSSLLPPPRLESTPPPIPRQPPTIPAQQGISVPSGWKLLQLPLLRPGTSRVFDVDSDGTDGLKYRVDTTTVTCTCPDFAQRRSRLPEDSIGRLCKHLGREVHRHVETEDPIIKAILSEYRKKYFYYQVTLPSGSQIALGIDVESPWIDVLARKCRRGERAGGCTGDYASYGFDRHARRWSYGSGPVGAGEIRDILEQMKY